jgi:hypothetical protein
MTDSKSTLPNPADLQKLFDDWWRAGSTVITTIAGALAALQIPSSIGYPIAGVVTVGGMVAAVVLHRRQLRRNKQGEALERAGRSEPHGVDGGAFRGLRRFLRGEQLPGPKRRQDAAQLFQRVVYPDFRVTAGMSRLMLQI